MSRAVADNLLSGEQGLVAVEKVDRLRTGQSNNTCAVRFHNSGEGNSGEPMHGRGRWYKQTG